ncbi:MAG: hypothetical protein RO469_11985 [Thermincola sp.]|nr:hypothetical protein [Thermincola sp.]
MSTVVTCLDEPETMRWLVEIIQEAVQAPPEDQAAVRVHETIRQIKNEFPEVNAVCGLSNVSYGLPNRKVLNQTFMIQTMTAGMDAYILDPLDQTLMGFYIASRALMGKDEYCLGFISAHRDGLYDK